MCVSDAASWYTLPCVLLEIMAHTVIFWGKEQHNKSCQHNKNETKDSQVGCTSFYYSEENKLWKRFSSSGVHWQCRINTASKVQRRKRKPPEVSHRIIEG